MNEKHSEPDRQQRLAIALAGTAEVLKGQLSAAGIRAWEWALEPFPMDVIEAALKRFIRGDAHRLEGQSGWMPVPEEVIAECRRVQEDMHTREVYERTNIQQLLAAVDDEQRYLPPTLECDGDVDAMTRKLAERAKMPGALK